ncbi:MAG: Chromosomal replication initiator protein DnaA [Rhodospirillaceae bacterium]|nr:MAG: Chromosomal replication initiator protein DnaA [Rhodospirillaceae bacterium]
MPERPPPRQFTLDLGHRPALGRDDFLVADSNRAAVAWIDRWPDWPQPALILHGPAGCGKSHLVQVFAARNGAVVVDGARLTADQPPSLVMRERPVAVENADRSGDETALLHLFNLARESHVPLLLTAGGPPARWSLRLPDLCSRLNAQPSVAIAEPDDALMAAVLVKMFADRQIRVGEECLVYLLRRMERSFATARGVVAAADSLALATRRPVNPALLETVLATLEGETSLK